MSPRHSANLLGHFLDVPRLSESGADNSMGGMPRKATPRHTLAAEILAKAGGKGVFGTRHHFIKSSRFGPGEA
jgi:hypothetical protein